MRTSVLSQRSRAADGNPSAGKAAQRTDGLLCGFGQGFVFGVLLIGFIGDFNVPGDEFDAEVEIVRKTRHLFDTALLVEQIQFVQFIKEFVEFLLKFDALIGVFEYALAFGFGKLFQTLTVQYPEDAKFECWMRLSFAESGNVTVTLPAYTKYIGTAPDFKNGETWELSFKDGVLAAQKVGEGT